MSLPVRSVDEFLDTERRTFLFCHDAMGLPIGYPMNLLAHRPPHLFFSTYGKSAKVAHLRRDPRAACMVVADATGEWLSITGRIDVVRPSPDEVYDLMSGRERDSRVSPEIADKARRRLLEGKRVLLRFTPDAPLPPTVRRCA